MSLQVFFSPYTVYRIPPTSRLMLCLAGTIPMSLHRVTGIAIWRVSIRAFSGFVFLIILGHFAAYFIKSNYIK